MGLSDEQAALFGQAARLHDLGKIGIPDRVLTKPGSLNDEEWTIMRTHTTMGAEILSGSASPILRVAAEVAASHHERWDGAGYPAGLAGEAIPLAARITCVADAFDAITTNRRYRAARPLDVAIQEIRIHSGSQFDASVVRVLAECTARASARAS
jgi:putative two-component system response regulator